MAIDVNCPKCGKPYKLKDEMGGKKARCKDCGAIIEVPPAYISAEEQGAFEIIDLEKTVSEERAAGQVSGAPQHFGQPAGPYAAPAYFPQVPPQNCGLATASLVLGIVSFVCGGLITAILAIVFGKSAQRKIEESRGALTGDGLARAGRILGGINIVIFMIVIIIYIIIAGMHR